MRGGEHGGVRQDAESFPFVIAAAHELKAPLALIRQLSLSLETGDLTAHQQERLLRQIVITSERGLQLTADLTKSVRLEEDIFRLQPLNTRQLCEEVAHELMPLFKARDRELRVSGSRKQVLAVGNGDLLKRILVNFADNALQYAGEGEPVEFQVGALNHSERVHVGVRDFGPAVPNRLWARLERQLGVSPQAIHSRPASSGLGLYLAGQFASFMHGSIGAVRHHNGATFYVDLLASKQLALL